jgi:hypothetical protein
MKKSKSLYHGHRFPAGVISCAVRWYFRFQLSLRDIEELLFERGVTVTYETIRCWCDKFGKGFAHRVQAARRKPGARGTSTRCSSPCVANRTCCGVRSTSMAPNSTSCYKSGATRPRPNVSSSACCARTQCHANIFDDPGLSDRQVLQEIEKQQVFVGSSLSRARSSEEPGPKRLQSFVVSPRPIF